MYEHPEKRMGSIATQSISSFSLLNLLFSVLLVFALIFLRKIR